MSAQELVGGGELRAHALGGTPRLLSAALIGGEQLAPLLRPLVGLGARGARPLHIRLGHRLRLRVALAGRAQLRHLGIQLALARGVDARELLLERRDPPAGRLRLPVLLGRVRSERLELRARALDPAPQAIRRARSLLGAQRDPLAGRARVVHAPRERVVALGTLGQRTLGLATPVDGLLQRRARAPSARPATRRARRSAACSFAAHTRSASRASSSRASSVWRSRRSCSSAASACRLSGRSRVRASRSTSSARSRFSCVRSSLSCARRRRLRCLPRPAASSISMRRSRGLEVTIASTRPCEMIEWVSLPRPVSESSSITSVSRQRAPLSGSRPRPRGRAAARSRSR